MNRLKDKNLYYVGGVVRDEILGIQSFDTDFCYEGNAIEFAQNRFGKNIVKVNPDFGTVRLNLDGKEIDIASTRAENYPKPGHLPVVKYIGCSLEEDLNRRDFTINAIAKNTVTGKIYDPLDGTKDIKSKKLRVLHEKSFVDDPTRIIRALKFAVRLGFNLSEESKKLQNEYLSEINYDISYHRLKKEIVETFNLNNGNAFDEFIEQKLYKLLGEVQTKPDIKGSKIQNAVQNTDFTPWIIYMSFFNLEKLPLTKSEKKIIEWARKLNIEKITNNTPKESILIHTLRAEE